MKIIANLHLTAAQRRHIRALIEQGLTEGSIRNFRYSLTPNAEGFDGVAEKTERDGWSGKVIVNRERFIVKQ